MMKRFNLYYFYIIPIIICFIFTSSCKNQATNASKNKIISIGRTTTEILFGLGFGKNIVAIDGTSTNLNPELKIENLNHHTQITTESILSFQPDIVFLHKAPYHDHIVEQLSKIKTIRVYRIDIPTTFEKAKETIKEVGKIMHVEQKANEIVNTIDEQYAQLNTDLEKIPKDKLKVMFLYGTGNSFLIAGNNTAVGSMIEIAGGINAVSMINGYIPFSSESIVAINPDVILTIEVVVDRIPIEELLSMTGIKDTNAGKNKRVVIMDNALLLGYGPRIIIGAETLAQKLYPEITF